MRFVVHNSFARYTVRSERVRVQLRSSHDVTAGSTCHNCGSQRLTINRAGSTTGAWLLRFHAEGESARTSGPIAYGHLYCSRSCAESYAGQSFDEGQR